MKKIIIVLIYIFTLSIISKAQTKYLTDTDFIKNLSDIKNEITIIKTENKEDIKFQKDTHFIQLQGYLTLNGNVWVPNNGCFVSTTMYGWLQMRDTSGNYQTNNEYVNVFISFWVNPNQYIFQTVFPNINVRVYDKTGKYVGSANTTGSISVSGWANSSFVNLNGSGYLSASLYVNE